MIQKQITNTLKTISAEEDEDSKDCDVCLYIPLFLLVPHFVPCFIQSGPM